MHPDFPCQNKCTLERGGNYCKTCYITVGERREWKSLTWEEKSAILTKIIARKDYFREKNKIDEFVNYGDCPDWVFDLSMD